MYKWEDIRLVHVEMTSRCNARCPMCARNQNGRTHARLAPTELTLADIQRLFPADQIQHLNRIYFCGNYGDPIMARDLLPALRHLRAGQPNLRLVVHTNGGARSTEWWAELATLADVRFGIDGLEDTNAVYRREVAWEKLIANLRAFIGAGGRAEIDFLVFRHNEHQVESARRYFAELGAKKISFKTTSRFFRYREVEMLDRFPVHNSQGDLVDHLQPPEGPQWRNATVAQAQQVIRVHGSWDQYLSQTEIHCRVLEEKNLYLSAEGFVFPCCWVGLDLSGVRLKENNQLYKLVEQAGGLETLSAKERSIAECLRSDFFQKVLPSAWGKGSVAAGRPRVCAKTCGAGLTPFDNQFSKSKEVPASQGTSR